MFGPVYKTNQNNSVIPISDRNQYDLKKKNILFFSPEITWNLYCGNSIWASCFLELLKEKYKCKISVWECIKNDISCGSKNIFNDKLDVNFVDLFQIVERSQIFQKNNTHQLILSPNLMFTLLLSNIHKFDYVIIRSIYFMSSFIKVLQNPSVLTQLGFPWYECTNIRKILNKIIYVVIDRKEEEKFINMLPNTFHMTLVKYYSEKKKYPNIPQYIIPPLLRDRSIYNKNFDLKNTVYDFCTVGTLHLNSNIESIIKCLVNTSYTLIIAGKIHKPFESEFNRLKEKYKNNKNIKFYCWRKGISKEESENIICKSKYGIRIDMPVECLSSKVLNYICYKRIPIIQRIKTHELLLGADYPFYIDKNPKESLNGLNNVLKNINDENLSLAKERVDIARNKLNIDELLKNNFSIN